MACSKARKGTNDMTEHRMDKSNQHSTSFCKILESMANCYQEFMELLPSLNRSTLYTNPTGSEWCSDSSLEHNRCCSHISRPFIILLSGRQAVAITELLTSHCWTKSSHSNFLPILFVEYPL